MKRPGLIAACLIVSGCVATDVGNPQTEPEGESGAEIRLQAFDEELPNALTLDDGVTIKEAWIAVDEAEFRADCEAEGTDAEGTDSEGTDTEGTDTESDTDTSDTDSSESEPDEETETEIMARQDGVVVTDLISGNSFPAPIGLEQPGTAFCEMRFRIRTVGADEAPTGSPAEMIGYSMLVRGTRGDGTAFVARGGFDESVTLEGDIMLVTESSRTLFLGFAANAWLPESRLEPLTGELIELDVNNNPAVYESFVEAVLGSARLFEDDGDGTLEPEETTQPLAVPR